MTKKVFDHIENLIANIIGVTENAYHINLELTQDDERQIISDIKKIHQLSPTLDNADLNEIKSSLPHNKEYAGGSLGDLVMNAQLVSNELSLNHPRYNPNL